MSEAGLEEAGFVDAQEAAENAGLVYVTDQTPGITRHRKGQRFAYKGVNRKPVTRPDILERIRKLAIPPAYEEVWICPSPNGHMPEFAAALPEIRARIDHDMALRKLSREKILATIVHLLESTMIRGGNEDYAKQNKSYGLTTLVNRHVDVDRSEVKFSFKGKSGKQWRLKLRDRRVANIIRQSQELPGQHLFGYLDEQGERHDVSSGDVNAYLKEISGRNITAKDFRTWTGTVLAAMALSEFERFDGQTAAKKNMCATIERVAARLGNTVTICRKCYIHPEVLKSYLSNELVLEARQEIKQVLTSDISALRPEEALAGVSCAAAGCQ